MSLVCKFDTPDQCKNFEVLNQGRPEALKQIVQKNCTTVDGNLSCGKKDLNIPCLVTKKVPEEIPLCNNIGCFIAEGVPMGNVSVCSTVTTSSSLSTSTITSSTSNTSNQTETTTSSRTAPSSGAPTTSTKPSNPPSSATPLNQDGPLAGIIIGSLIGGALLASLALWFLMLRKRRSNQTSHNYSEGIGVSGASGNGKQQQPNITYGAVAPIDRYLPQPAEDDAITGELSKIRDKIKNHTQNFYNTSPVNAHDIDQSGLLDLAHATGISTSHLAELLANPQTRLSATRLYLAWIILSRVGLEPLVDASYLPNNLATLVTSTSANSKDNGKQDFTNRWPKLMAVAGKVILVTKWKAITAELLQDSGSHQALRNRHTERSINEVVQTTDMVLRPFIKSTGDEAGSDKRLRNLEGTIRKAAQFAFLLFSQPSLFVFDWTSRNNELVVFPGLYQTVGNDGIVLSPPRPFGETEVTRT